MSTASSPCDASNAHTSRSKIRFASIRSSGIGGEKAHVPDVLGSFHAARWIALQVQVELQRRHDRDASNVLLCEEDALVPRRENVHVGPGFDRLETNTRRQ